VTRRGQAKVLDFGLAHVTPPQSHLPIEEASTLARTDTGILLGTIDYMSPEQALGHEIDARTDIFSLGVVLYEMATGRRPFSTENKLETIDRIAHAEPEPPSQLNKQISSQLQRIIAKCLEKSPQRRYQSASLLSADLRPEIEQLLAKRRTTGPRAFDFYNQARVYLQRFENVKNIDAAISLFEQSIQLDPNYALAHAGLGEAYWRKYDATQDTQWVAKAVANCQRTGTQSRFG
jgi:serine/threonine protein kinase